MRDLIAALHARMSAHPEAPALAGPPLKAVRIDNAADEATVWVYDVIGDWGVSAAELVPAIESISAPAITVRVNSPGGDYFAGVAIANALVRHPAAVTVHVDALAASAASVIAMAGDEIVMHPGAQMMIHDALTVTMGNAAEHTKTATLLDSASQDIAGVYAARSGLHDAEHFRAQMRAETWLTAESAVAAGLATRVAEREAPAAEVTDASPRWVTLLHDFRAATATPVPSTVDAQTSSAELPTAEDASPDGDAVPAPLPIAARFCSANAERKRA
jgi:ATP-dependent protease ClpP protease subunit